MNALYISVSPGEIWAAREEDGELAALRLLRTGAAGRVGETILGRIVALRPELPAALVEIGLPRPAFLDAKDADRRRGIGGLTEGQAVIVEMTREARDDKAAGVRLTRAGGERRAQLEAMARATRPPARLETALSPIVALLKESLVPAPEQILIDDRAAFAEARALLATQGASLVPRLAYYGDAAPLFDHAGLAAAIETLFQPVVALPGGGGLTIEATRAATMIDVDSGGRMALAANLEAARIAARQIRLRNIAGPIVIDFIGMKKKPERERVLAALEKAFRGDDEKPELLGWTRLGHVELVRRRRHAALAEILFERDANAALQKTALTVALEALRAVMREMRARPGRVPALVLHPEIAAALGEGEGLGARRMLEAQLGEPLRIDVEPRRVRSAFDIRPR